MVAHGIQVEIRAHAPMAKQDGRTVAPPLMN